MSKNSLKSNAKRTYRIEATHTYPKGRQWKPQHRRKVETDLDAVNLRTFIWNTLKMIFRIILLVLVFGGKVVCAGERRYLKRPKALEAL